MQKPIALFSEENQWRKDGNILIILILVIFLASLLRLYNLGEHSLWYDEAASVRNVMGLLRLYPYEDWGLFGLLKRERVPPLYFIYMIPFYYFSSNEWSIRLASVIFGIATIPLIYYFGSRLFNRKIGFIGALLLTFSPLHIYYSQELRPYSLFLFLSILVFYLSYLALEDNKNVYYAGLVVVSVLGVYTYIYTVFVLFIVNLYLILSWKAYQHLVLRKWLLSHIIMVILCIPEVYHTIYHIVIGKTDLSDFPFGLRSIIANFYIFTMGRIFFLTKSHLIFILLQAIVFGVGLLMGIWALWREKAKEGGRQPLFFFMAVTITYIAICLISVSLIPLFDEARVNYIIFFLPFYYLLVAKGWDYLPNATVKITLVSLAVFVSLIAVYPFFFEWDQVGKGNFRAAAEYVQRNFKENDVIYHVTSHSALPFAYYFDWLVPQIRIREINPNNNVNNDRFWLIVREEKGGLEFSLASFREETNRAQEQQSDAASVCNSYILDKKLHLVGLQVFPGKNRLIVCLYRRETSNSRFS